MNSITTMAILISFWVITVQAQEKSPWKIHDINRPQPQIVTPSTFVNIAAPADAVILYNGSDLSQWQSPDGSPPKWLNGDGFFECVKDRGNITTRQSFGDVQLHIEWSTPSPAKGKGQGRGNSGVFLMGLYEVQVLDSYQNTTYPDGQAGAVYGQSPPLVNASLAPGKWQSYDIIFRRPYFDHSGELIKPAVMTVFHNGILVQDHFELWGGTEWLRYKPYNAHADKLPLELQDHENPVRYRNIWLRELEKDPEVQPVYPKEIPFTEYDFKLYNATFIAGDKTYKIHPVEDKLMLFTENRNFELVKYSKERLSVKTTAIDLYFSFDESGIVNGMVYQFEGKKTKTTMQAP